MKKILILLLLFNFYYVGHGFKISPLLFNKYFQDKSNCNYDKYNTLTFQISKPSPSENYYGDYYVNLMIRIEQPLYDLLDIRFYNKNYMFTTYNFYPDTKDYIRLLISAYDYSNPNALNKIIETLKEGNITMEYTTLNGSYQYKIDDETSKILAEIILYNSQNH